MKRGLFLRIEEFSRRHHRLVFALTALLVLGSWYLGSRLSLDGDILNLVPRDNRRIDTLREALREFGSLDMLLLLVESRQDQGAEELQEFADSLADRLRELPSLRSVEHRIDPSGPFLEFFRRNQVLFLPPQKLPELASRLSDETIRARVRENRQQLTGATSFFVKHLLAQDPLLISPLFFEEVLRGSGPFRAEAGEGYYMSRDGKALLLLAKPVRPPQDLAFDRELLEQVEGAVAEVSGEVEGGAPAVSYGGSYVSTLDDSRLIMRDMVRNGVLSFFAIAFLYGFCYRRLSAILYSFVPLLVGQCLTLSVAYLFLRNLNSATTGFSAMLMGLGTDFTIVMYARYVEERQAGRSLEEALQRMMGSTAFGVFTGAITSAGTFYSMCITEYRGLRDFGFLVGSGILLCLAAILFLLPAMIAWNEGRRPGPTAGGRFYLHSFGIERLLGLSTRHPWPVLLASAVLTAFALFHAWNVEFSDDVQDLRSADNRGVQTVRTITRKFGTSFNPMMALSRGPNQEAALALNREAHHRLDALVADHTLHGYDSIANYLPSPAEQQEVIEALRRGSPDTFDVKRIERTFRAALQENGFRVEAYEEYLAALPAALRPERPVTIDDLRAAGLERFIDRFVSKGEDGLYRAVTYLFPAGEAARRTVPPALARALDRPEEGIELTGVNVASSELRRIFRRDAWRAVLLGLALVTALLWLDFRSLRLTLLADVQVLVGVVWMLGGMHLAGLKMNFINAFVTTMILGVGIDYGIHFIHRISQEGLANRAGLMETGKAVAMAALTNVAGFGILGLSAYPGLRSMGIVCAIGSVTCLLSALATLPALMTVGRARPHAAPPA
jgi:hypothetical protein